MRCVADDEPNPLPNGYSTGLSAETQQLSPLNTNQIGGYTKRAPALSSRTGL
jgi:hypothetical protein